MSFMLMVLLLLGIEANQFCVSEQKEVMVYGIVYMPACNNSETYHAFYYEYIDVKSYSKRSKELKEELEVKYPNHKRVVVRSSFFADKEADNVTVMKWSKQSGNCRLTGLIVQFGRSAEQALERAMNAKNSAVGANGEYNIVFQKYW